MVPPLFPPPLTPSPSSPHPPLYLHQSCYPPQVNVLTVKRPWWIWCIGNLEIVKSTLYTVLTVYHFMEDPPRPDDFIWILYFLGTLGILTGFFQGIGLRSGLKSDDDSVTLWYCRVWIACQIVFVVIGIFSMVTVIVVLIKQIGNPSKLIFLLVASCYPIISLLVVRSFAKKLTGTELPPLPNY